MATTPAAQPTNQDHVRLWFTCSEPGCGAAKAVCRVCERMDHTGCAKHSEEAWEEHNGFFYHAERQNGALSPCSVGRVCTKCHTRKVAPERCLTARSTNERVMYGYVCPRGAINPDGQCGECLGWGQFSGRWACGECDAEKRAASLCGGCGEPSMSRYDCTGCDRPLCRRCAPPVVWRQAGTLRLYCKGCSAD